MYCPRYLLALILILPGLSACAPAADTPVAQPAGAGLAPPPGRTPEETTDRRAYYQTPRGDEF